jgi:hypothetical protein
MAAAFHSAPDKPGITIGLDHTAPAGSSPAMMSTYLRQRLLNHVLGNDPYPQPDTVYVALFTGDPTPEGTGPEAAVTRQASTWTPPTGTSNESPLAEPLTFPNMPGGEVTHVGQYDAATGGNLLLFDQLEVPKTFTAGDTATFAAPNLVAAFT